MTDARYYLPVTLDQLQSLQSMLDTVSAREANPDAEVFRLLEVVCKSRAMAIRYTISPPESRALAVPGRGFAPSKTKDPACCYCQAC